MNIKRNKGFSLIELMIAVMLGLLVLAAITAVTVSTLTTNSANLNMIRLDQELRAAMQIMARDIRRAGSWNDIRDPETTVYPDNSEPVVRYDVGMNRNCNPFMATGNDIVTTDISGTESTSDTEAESITYTYDLDDDGIVDSNENLGFRLTTNKSIQMRRGDSWESITDPKTLTITDLDFILTDTPVRLSGITTDACGTVIACNHIRQVEIKITGQTSIGSGQTAERTISETIRVRNDRYEPLNPPVNPCP